jgi:outer membrane protein assembly factor BamB
MATGTTTTTAAPLPTAPPGVTLVRVISGPKLHLGQPQAAAVSKGQLFVATNPGGSGAVVVIDATTGAPEEVLDRPSCQFADPSLVQAQGGSIFVSSFLGGVTQLRSGRCVGALDGSPYGFHVPGPSAVAGGALFVANSLSGPSLTSSITELNASTGALSRVIPQPANLFGVDVAAVAAEDNSLYVAGARGQAVRVDASTGAATRHFNVPFGDLATGAVLKGPTLYISVVQGGLLALNTTTGHVRQIVGQPPSVGFSAIGLIGLPTPMVFCGDDLFYLAPSSSGSAFVKEVDTATGKVARVISGPAYHLGQSSQMAAWDQDIFVTDPALPTGKGLVAVLHPPAGALTEIDATTGALVRRISSARYDFQVPEGIAASGDDLFVADSGANAVTEVDPRTGRLVDVMSGVQFQFDSPQGLAVYGGHLFAVNQSGDSVTDIDLGP